MWRRFLCKVLGHDFRAVNDMEVKIAFAEIQAGERTARELPVSICMRCEVNWGVPVKQVVRPVKECRCKEAVGYGKHVTCGGYSFDGRKT